MCGHGLASDASECAACGEPVAQDVDGVMQPTPVSLHDVLHVGLPLFFSRIGRSVLGQLTPFLMSFLFLGILPAFVFGMQSIDFMLLPVLLLVGMALCLIALPALAASNAVKVVRNEMPVWYDLTFPDGRAFRCLTLIVYCLVLSLLVTAGISFLATGEAEFDFDNPTTTQLAFAMLYFVLSGSHFAVALPVLFEYADRGTLPREGVGIRFGSPGFVRNTMTQLLLFFASSIVVVMGGLLTCGLGLLVLVPLWWHLQAVAYLLMTGRLRAN